MKKTVLWASVVSVGAVAAVAGFAQQAVEPKLSDAPPAVRLVTEAQYLNSVQGIFGSGLKYPVKFAPVKRVGGLVAVGTGTAMITAGALDQFDSAARAIADQVVSPANRGFTVACRPKKEDAPDDACAGQFFKQVGALLYRRPLPAAGAAG